MRKIVFVVMVCLLTSAARAQSSVEEVKRKIVGTWKVVSSQTTLKNGKKSFDPVLGPHGMGFLIYSADGHMCAELMNPDRPAWKNNRKPTDQEKLSAFDGFFAYCGRYEIDAEKHLLVHLPEISMTQDYVGTRQIRPYRFEGTRMVLGDKAKDDPEVESWQIVWEKVK
jgi:Lipocalin-like domain